MNRKYFEKLVEEALVDLPREFAEKLNNVAVMVEDEPTREQQIKLKLYPGVILFGLYEGIPQTKRGQGYTMVPPDKITIFQKPIEYFCRTEEEIKTQVRATVLHEIGHHFGMREEDFREKRG